MKKINFILLIYLFVAFACTNSENITSDRTETTSEMSDEKNSNAVFYKIKKADGAILAEIMINGQNVELKVADMHYKTKLKGDKRKYQSRNGDIVAEVKFKDAESFKLRTTEGELKWKVKLYDDKFKISDNEENLEPFQVKIKEENRYKVYNQDTEIGDVRLSDAKITISGEGVEYSVDANKISGAFGVMLMEMDMLDKTILIAELLAKGK